MLHGRNVVPLAGSLSLLAVHSYGLVHTRFAWSMYLPLLVLVLLLVVVVVVVVVLLLLLLLLLLSLADMAKGSPW
jgi:hypothetical protein